MRRIFIAILVALLAAYMIVTVDSLPDDPMQLRGSA